MSAGSWDLLTSGDATSKVRKVQKYLELKQMSKRALDLPPPLQSELHRRVFKEKVAAVSAP